MLAELLTVLTVVSFSSDSAYAAGNRIYIEPVGVSFALPPYWVDSAVRVASPRHSCGSGAKPTIQVGLSSDRHELANATGEWDREYSTVADSVLPLWAAVAQVGGEPWGAKSGCYADLQARVYVIDISSAEVARCVEERGQTIANRFFRSTASVTDSSGWHIARLQWRAWYYDYGSTAHMDYYVRDVSGRSVVLLFMYADSMNPTRDDLSAILSSWR